MYKKNTQCNKCKHYDADNHRCDAFCSFMKETCDDVYQQGRADAIDEFVNALKTEQFSEYVMDIVYHWQKQLKERKNE